MSIVITQSLMKDYREYTQKRYCGLQLKAKYLDGVIFDPSDAMLIGIWFENQCTGGLPKNGVVPEPEYTSRGASKGELKAKWAYAAEQADRFRQAMSAYQFEIKRIGEKITTPDGIAQGHIDIIAVDNRRQIKNSTGRMVDNPDYQQEIIIDIKNTGLLDNKWEEMGWDLESLPDKPKIMIQPVHYTWLYKQVNSRYPSFYFFVHSSTNGVDSRIFRVHIEPSAYDRHEKQIALVKEAVELEAQVGFKAYPQVKRCLECPLHLRCDSAISVPVIDEVHYS